MQNNPMRKDTNHDFLETPHSNKQRLREKEKLSEDIKAKYITELEERNRRLKYQIIKINEMLDEQQEKTVVKKEHKLIPKESSADVIKKQLQNVYKQIKNYEKQISNLESKQSGGLVSDKMSRLENILKEKTTHLEKLKLQLSSLTKSSLDNSKRLKNNAGKEEIENSMLKYNDQLKILREKVRQAEEKEKKKMENGRKQFDYIKKLERELVQSGVSMEELEELKKNNIYNHIYEKLNNPGENLKSSEVKAHEPEREIEDMSADHYAQLYNEVKLYKKLHADYEKRLLMFEKQKQQEEKTTLAEKQRLQQKEEQIIKLQEEINELKGKLRKNTIKANVPAKDESGDKSHERPKPTVKIPKPNQKTITDQTHIKFDEKGLPSEKGKRFTDRTALGKATNVRIISVKVWTESSTFAICGMQLVYKVGDTIKVGIEHVGREVKKNCSQNLMELAEGDYLKQVSGHLSQNNIVEYLVLMSSQSVIGRFGVAKPTQKQFNFSIDEDELPICLYGSLLTVKDGKKDMSYLEQIGFEISRDKAFGKEDKFD